ncbi:MAG: BrnT family toxin [Acidobacteriota bacterium]|jgi:uncharacterized DUF497 family protein
MKFEWDAGKARRNFHKHGITFDRAITAFDDPFALIAPDEKHSSTGEIREWLIGESDNGVLVVVFTRREEGQVCRVISARRASRRERISYEEFKRVSL